MPSRTRALKNGGLTKEYDLYVPSRSRRGTPLPASGLARLKKRLLKRFGGLTHFPQRNEGLWKLGHATFRDEIVILRVLSDFEHSTVKFWRSLQQDLKRQWGQQEVLIVVRDVALITPAGSPPPPSVRAATQAADEAIKTAARR